MLSFSALATHNRSGEITYRHISGNTFEFTITTCTKLSSDANRTELEISFGDGITETFLLTFFEDYASTDTKKNLYIGRHTYTGPGSYVVSVSDPNRNANVLNILNSVDQIFCIQTRLIISPFLGQLNNSLLFDDCPCPEEACAGKPWIYNLGAYDPDGDSLSYELIACKGEDCVDMPIPEVFQFPQDVGGGVFAIDAATGTIIWDSPNIQGEYNFAIKVYEYRNNVQIGYVIRDMQITVQGNCNNNPPQLEVFSDTCIQADSLLNQIITASDTPANPNDIPVLNWDYFGEAFHLTPNTALFSSPDAPGNPISANVTWTPNCSNVRYAPYLFTFEASDSGPNVILKDVKTVRVKVNGEKIQGLSVSANLNQAVISWNLANCPSIIGYKVYRSLDSSYIENSCCERGEALALGYELIAEIEDKTDTSYTDFGPLIVGNQYCYTVTAVYQNKTEGCITPPVCIQLPFDLPAITHVTVFETNISTGIDSIRWTHPKELDTLIIVGPYQYKVYAGRDGGETDSLIYSSSIQNTLEDCDTFWVDSSLNTEKFEHSYQVELLSNDQVIGRSSVASSIYLNTIPNDNQVELTWENNVPWQNFEYHIYKANSSDINNFVLIDTVFTNYYLDDSLINGDIACYRVLTLGKYSLPSLTDTLYNWSQISCAAANDFTAPCAPNTVLIKGDCLEETTTVTWNNPNNSCADDVVSYQLFYSPIFGGEFELIAEINSAQDTSYIHDGRGTIAGCYYVTAKDSIQYNNISVRSDTVCIDNCEPRFVLPNVFTPNFDGNNELYHPRFPIKFVEKIEFTVYNRWGQTVHYTEDPNINWDGFDQKENLPLKGGVYHYTCRVYALTLTGLMPYDLSGFIHIIHNQ